jgi:hypothetical protein
MGDLSKHRTISIGTSIALGVKRLLVLIGTQLRLVQDDKNWRVGRNPGILIDPLEERIYEMMVDVSMTFNRSVHTVEYICLCTGKLRFKHRRHKLEIRPSTAELIGGDIGPSL